VRTIVKVAGLLLFAACGDPGGNPRPAVPDAGPSDAGPSDAGPSDAGPSDAGPSDAGPSDAGSSCGAQPSSPQLPACRDGCGYLCANQCGDICLARGCWHCLDGGWQQVAVDCQTGCP
jgi:hypothetical protein